MSEVATKEPSLRTTKQMLDELDALMEQMLALPVSGPEDAPAFPKDIVKPHALTASLTLLEAPEPVTHPVLNRPHLALAAAPAPLTNEVLPASLLPRIEPLLAEIPDAEVAATTLWVYQPLVWVNQAFDGCTMLLGGLGALLRTQASRMLLGLGGLAMLAVSAAWVAKDWLGWNW